MGQKQKNPVPQFKKYDNLSINSFCLIDIYVCLSFIFMANICYIWMMFNDDFYMWTAAFRGVIPVHNK